MIMKVIDSNNFNVGGGVASALAGAMAAGMISMVAKLSIKKEYGLTRDHYNEIALESDELAKKLIHGAKLDENAFLLIKQAYALPKISDKEKVYRRSAIQNGGIEAATVPMDNGYMCYRVYELGMMLKDKSNPNAGSDLSEAVMLAESGIKGCVLNIEANLPLIKNEEINMKFKGNIESLKAYQGGVEDEKTDGRS